MTAGTVTCVVKLAGLSAVLSCVKQIQLPGHHTAKMRGISSQVFSASELFRQWYSVLHGLFSQYNDGQFPVAQHGLLRLFEKRGSVFFGS